MKFKYFRIILTFIFVAGLVLISLLSNKIFFGSHIISSCRESPNPTTCKEVYVIRILEKMGPKSAFLAIERLKVDDRQFGPSCHSFAHVIGVAAYNLLLKGRDVFAMPVSVCDYGYYHGLMMEIVMHKGDFLYARNYCEKLRSLSGNNHDVIDQCYHGIGHGLPLYFALNYKRYNNDLPAIIKNSLTACETSFNGNQNCKVGVFGGIASFFMGDHDIKLENPKVSEIFEICKIQKSDLRGSCYEMMTPALLFLANQDVNVAIDLSRTFISDSNDMISIARPLGASITTFKDDIVRSEAVQICQKFKGGAVIACTGGYDDAMVDAKPVFFSK